eukprot:1160492-Pelagomonas_calceolata.AAC.8
MIRAAGFSSVAASANTRLEEGSCPYKIRTHAREAGKKTACGEAGVSISNRLLEHLLINIHPPAKGGYAQTLKTASAKAEKDVHKPGSKQLHMYPRLTFPLYSPMYNPQTTPTAVLFSRAAPKKFNEIFALNHCILGEGMSRTAPLGRDSMTLRASRCGLQHCALQGVTL